MTQIIAQSSLLKAQPKMGIINNLLPNHPQNQAPPPQQGQVQPPQQPPNVAIILNLNEKVPLPQGRQVWSFKNAHDVQTLSSDPPWTRTPLPPFLNPTPRPFQQPNIRVSFLNPSSPNLNLPFINSFLNQWSKNFSLLPPSQQSIIFQNQKSTIFPPPPFLNSDVSAQNMVLRSGRTFNREPLPPIPPTRPAVFPPDPNPLLNHSDQSPSYDILQHMDCTPARISILELIKKSKSHQEVLSQFL